MQRSNSMPVKPRYFAEDKKLSRSEEKETLFSTTDISQIEEVVEIDNEDESIHEVEDIDRHEDLHIEIETHQNNINESLHNNSRYNSPCIYQDAKPFSYPARLINKSGYQNISFTKIPQRSWQYFKDLVTTLIEQKWKYTIILFVSSFFAVWFFCAAIWYLIGYAHGDLSFDPKTGERLVEGEQTCVNGAETYIGFFIYTVETHASTGYGERHPTDECPEAVFFFAAQLILYIGVEGMLISIIYAKIAKPARQVTGTKFSKRAVVCLRDGKHCLVIRVCDRQSQQTIGSKVTLYLLQNKSTLEGEFIEKSQIELQIENKGKPFLFWPTTICHIIDKNSPFYKYTAKDFAKNDYEIVVSCTGNSESTGQFTECITSYIPGEVYWGARFVNIIEYDWTRNAHSVDYDKFDATVSVGMPEYSAHQLYHAIKLAKSIPRSA